MALAIRSGIPAEEWRHGPERDLETGIALLHQEQQEAEDAQRR